MAVVITVPSHAGQGYVVQYTGLTGPVPVDDYMQIDLEPTGTGNPCIFGTALTLGFTSGNVTLGEFVAGQTVVSQLAQYVAPGTSMDLRWIQFHKNGTVVALATIPNATLWDPTGGLYDTLGKILQGSGGVLSEILNSVRRTY